MIAAAFAITLSGLLVALVVAVLIYVIGIYVLHAPQPVVGVIALLVLILLLFGNVGV